MSGPGLSGGFGTRRCVPNVQNINTPTRTRIVDSYQAKTNMSSAAAMMLNRPIVSREVTVEQASEMDACLATSQG